jgi:hypothetical protein
VKTYLHFDSLVDIDANGLSKKFTNIGDLVLFIPSSWVSAFDVDVTSIPHKFYKSAIPSLLENRLLSPVEELDFFARVYEKNKAIVYVIKKKVVEEILNALKSLDYISLKIYPDYYLLPFDGSKTFIGRIKNTSVIRLGAFIGTSGPKLMVNRLAEIRSVENGAPISYLDFDVTSLEIYDHTLTDALPLIEDKPSPIASEITFLNKHKFKIAAQFFLALLTVVACLNVATIYEARGALFHDRLKNYYSQLLNVPSNQIKLNQTVTELSDQLSGSYNQNFGTVIRWAKFHLRGHNDIKLEEIKTDKDVISFVFANPTDQVGAVFHKKLSELFDIKSIKSGSILSVSLSSNAK